MALMEKLFSSNHEKRVEPLFSAAPTPEKTNAIDRLSRKIAAAHVAGSISSEVWNITPALAEYILNCHNRSNRSVRRARVAEYAKAMTEGRWLLTAKGISFDCDGRLIDGQHRLLAVIESGRDARMTVSFGEHPEAFDVIDTGATRGGADTLHAQGFKNTSALAAAARMVAAIESSSPTSNLVKLANDEIGPFVKSRRGLAEATTAGHTVAKRRKCSSAATTAAFYYIATRSKSARRLPHFIEAITSGAGLPKGDAALVLRDGLRENWTGGGFLTGTTRSIARAAAIILAWNLWIRGRKASPAALKWDGSKPFPMPE
jgi:hypothetical protein